MTGDGGRMPGDGGRMPGDGGRMTGDGGGAPIDDLRERVAADVDRRLAALRERFGEFPVVEEAVENDPAFFERGRRLAAEGWRGDAGAWVEDGAGRVLFVRHEDAPDRWGTPGGGHEPGESFAETARREVREETGVDPELTDVWRVRRREFFDAGDPGRRLEMLTVRFAAAVEDPGPLDVGDDEIVEARWFEEPPGAVHEVFADRVHEWAGPTGEP